MYRKASDYSPVAGGGIAATLRARLSEARYRRRRTSCRSPIESLVHLAYKLLRQDRLFQQGHEAAVRCGNEAAGNPAARHQDRGYRDSVTAQPAEQFDAVNVRHVEVDNQTAAVNRQRVGQEHYGRQVGTHDEAVRFEQDVEGVPDSRIVIDDVYDWLRHARNFSLASNLDPIVPDAQCDDKSMTSSA